VGVNEGVHRMCLQQIPESSTCHSNIHDDVHKNINIHTFTTHFCFSNMWARRGNRGVFIFYILCTYPYATSCTFIVCSVHFFFLFCTFFFLFCTFFFPILYTSYRGSTTRKSWYISILIFLYISYLQARPIVYLSSTFYTWILYSLYIFIFCVMHKKWRYYKSLLQNILCFIGLFCKRDLSF